jgi:hypothetical protein
VWWLLLLLLLLLKMIEYIIVDIEQLSPGAESPRQA